MFLFKRHGRQKPKIGYLFFGGCGSNFALQIINSLHPDDYPELSIFVANTDADHLEDFFGDEKNEMLVAWYESRRLKVVQLGPEITGGDGAGANPEIGFEAARTEGSKTAIRNFLSENSINIKFAGAGKGTGGPTLQVAAEICKELESGIPPQLQKISIAVVVMPRGDEGLSVNADAARDAIVELVPTITIYNSKIDEYLKGLPDARKLAFGTLEGNRIVDEMAIRPTLQTCYEVTQRTGERHLDRADMRSRLREGKLLYSGEIRFTKAEGESMKAERIVSGLFSGHFQEISIAQNAENVMLWFIGWEPLLEQSRVVELVGEFVTKDNPSKKDSVKILTSVRRNVPDEEDRRVIVWVVSKNIKEVHATYHSALTASKQVPMVEISPPPAPEPVVATGILEKGRNLLRRDDKPMRIPTVIVVEREEKTVGLHTKHARRYSELKKKGASASRKEWEALQKDIRADTTFLIDIPDVDWEEQVRIGTPRAPQHH